ncbi:hypothetical protein MXL91_15305 [Achromobacter ruhlandii]|uniref:hypothetical protein n=1 Tax=Achromobacter ruhlandii TaxID=72557 RepID=UPI0028ABB796|nr:hypothetical protein [Achromobacter ruhlandii]MEB6662820.1 hypothetical protein [Achromobacter ruhlandii]
MDPKSARPPTMEEDVAAIGAKYVLHWTSTMDLAGSNNTGLQPESRCGRMTSYQANIAAGRTIPIPFRLGRLNQNNKYRTYLMEKMPLRRKFPPR